MLNVWFFYLGFLKKKQRISLCTRINVKCIILALYVYKMRIKKYLTNDSYKS